MRLLNLELRNWSCHEDIYVDLSRGLQIEGRNGSGKSSILDAIRFIFSGKATGYKKRIRNGARTSTVILVFENDRKTYRVEKRLHVEKNRAAEAEMTMNEKVVADNQKTVYETLQSILSEQIIDKLLYIPQGELTSIIDELHLKGGRQKLDSLFGLDRLESVYMGIGDELKTEGARLDEKGRQVFAFPQDFVKGASSRMKELDDENKWLEKDVKDLQVDEENSFKEAERLQKDIEDMESVKKRKDALRRELSDMSIEITALEKELEAANSNLSGVEEKRNELRTYEEKERSLEKFAAILHLLELRERAQMSLEELGDLDSLSDNISYVKNEIATIPQVEKERSECMSSYRELDNKVAALEEQKREREQFLKDLGSLKGGAKCPRCGQPLSKEHLDKERRKTSKELEGLDSVVSRAAAGAQKEKVRLEGLENSLRKLREKGTRLNEMTASLEGKKASREKIDARIFQIDTELKGAGHSGEPMDDVRGKAKVLESVRGILSQLKKDLEREASLVQKISELEASLKKARKDADSMVKEDVRLPFNEAKLDAARVKREEKMREYYELKTKANDLKNKIETNGIEKESLERDLKSFKELNRRLDEKRRYVNLLKRARDVFDSNKGLPKYLRERYIKQLSGMLTHHFMRINENPRYQEITFDETYDIRIKSTHGELSIEQISGGEKAQLALAMRIALMELLSPIRLMILDEPFGSLDTEHAELLGAALSRISGDGQLILVTHIPVESLQLPMKVVLEGY